MDLQAALPSLFKDAELNGVQAAVLLGICSPKESRRCFEPNPEVKTEVLLVYCNIPVGS